MNDLIQIERVGADILRPYSEQFIRRYGNHYDTMRGTRYVNMTPCPLCAKYLKGQDCGACPMDEVFGVSYKTNMDMSGCKIFIRDMWGPIQFGDFPNFTVRSERFNPQLQTMNNWFRKTFR